MEKEKGSENQSILFPSKRFLKVTGLTVLNRQTCYRYGHSHLFKALSLPALKAFRLLYVSCNRDCGKHSARLPSDQ
jgi:hypothetical protein